jgi:hypothetical protein
MSARMATEPIYLHLVRQMSCVEGMPSSMRNGELGTDFTTESPLKVRERPTHHGYRKQTPNMHPSSRGSSSGFLNNSCIVVRLTRIFEAAQDASSS